MNRFLPEGNEVTIATALREDSRALAVLCTGLGVVTDARPFSLAEWAEIGPRIADPGDLFGRRPASIASKYELDDETAGRIFALLEGAQQFDAHAERLDRRGIWVVTRAEADFPKGMAGRLGPLCPPVLFGLGPAHLLDGFGVALLGEGDLDDAADAFAGDLGRACAMSGQTVVSSTERGPDRVGLIEALRAGGTAVGVVGDDLERRVRLRIFRDFIASEQLLVVSPFLPDGGIEVGRQETRNRVIYGLVRHAVVVSCGDGSGDTWSSAVENIEKGWVPLFVRSGTTVPHGNRTLCERDGIPLNAADLPEGIDIGEWLTAVAEEAIAQKVAANAPAAFDAVLPEDGGSPEPEPEPPPAPRKPAKAADLFDFVWSHLEAFLAEERSEKEVAEAFSLNVTQARAWLQRGVDEGRARRTTRPVRYVAIPVSDRDGGSKNE